LTIPYLVRSVLKAQLLRLASSSNGNVSLIEDFLHEMVAKTCGGSSDEEMRGMMADVAKDLTKWFFKDAVRNIQVLIKKEKWGVGGKRRRVNILASSSQGGLPTSETLSLKSLLGRT
jgi:hypothetical protein